MQTDPAVASVGAKDATVGADGKARLHLTTGVETSDDHEHGDLIVTPVSVSTDLQRTQISNLLELVQALILDALPGPVQGIVAQVLGPLKSSTQAKLQELVSVHGPVTWITVNHHGPAGPATPAGR